jgi:hypothetical protein
MLTTQNESTFERCPHDKQNPYVMISREMAQDKSISPKARGVLLYLLSLPSDWKIYHSQLQDGLGVGESYVNSAMDEIVKNGYADRSRQRVKGVFQPYKYIIREVKKCLPNGENQAGFSRPENPGLQSKHSSKQNKQQQATPAAAGFSTSKKKIQQDPVIHECLKDIDIPQSDKAWITARYDKETAKTAVAYVKHPKTVITKSLGAALKWACEIMPPIPKNIEEEGYFNKIYAAKYDGMKNKVAKIECCSKHVEIVHGGASAAGVFVRYDEKGFMEKFKEALKVNKFKVL